MNISEEAKEALANASLIKARKRLVRDGCHTDAAMRRRLMVLVTERNLPPAEYAKLMHKRVLTGSFLDFCKKHEVSLDWLMDGSLQGLARMKRFVAPIAAPRKVFSADELLAQMALLDPADRKIVTDYINQLAQRSGPNA